MEGGSIRPVGIGNLGNATDDHLGGKRRRSSDLTVFRLVEGKLAEGLRFEGKAGQSVAGFERLEENLRLFFRRIQFEVDCYLHDFYSLFEYLTCQTDKEKAHSSSP